MFGLIAPTQDKIFLNFIRVGTSTVIHELGHVLGDEHMVNSSNRVMSYSRTRSSSFTSGAVRAIVGAYR